MIRGLRGGREGLVSTQRQYEFLHQVLEEMVCGREGEGGREETDDGGKSKNKKKNKKTKGVCT